MSQAFKITIPATDREPALRTHGGYEWIYVLSGRLRLVLGEHDIVMGAGEAAEFDTRVPHWFEPAGNQAVEIVSLFGTQGERAHLRASARRPGTSRTHRIAPLARSSAHSRVPPVVCAANTTASPLAAAAYASTTRAADPGRHSSTRSGSTIVLPATSSTTFDPIVTSTAT